MIWNQYNSITIEYQKIKNLLDNALNQLSRFKTKSWVKQMNRMECAALLVK